MVQEGVPAICPDPSLACFLLIPSRGSSTHRKALFNLMLHFHCHHHCLWSSLHRLYLSQVLPMQSLQSRRETNYGVVEDTSPPLHTHKSCKILLFFRKNWLVLCWCESGANLPTSTWFIARKSRTKRHNETRDCHPTGGRLPSLPAWKHSLECIRAQS